MPSGLKDPLTSPPSLTSPLKRVYPSAGKASVPAAGSVLALLKTRFAGDYQKFYQLRLREMKSPAIPGNKLALAIDQNLALDREVKSRMDIVD